MNLRPQTHTEPIGEASGQPELPGAHASAIRRMIAKAPPFRPEASPDELVQEFANGANRLAAFLELYKRGDKSLAAVRQGLTHSNWHIRRWSAAFADNFADSDLLRALIPLLRDPKAEVRVWAVHTLSCDSCKDGPNPIDSIPLLLERIEKDESIRVRRQAVAMLAHHRAPDTRVIPYFERILSDDDDQKLRLHAEQGLKRYAAAGLGG